MFQGLSEQCSYAATEQFACSKHRTASGGDDLQEMMRLPNRSAAESVVEDVHSAGT